MRIDPAELTRAESNAIMNGLIAPRPIAWVSTLSASGQPNLAPFSFFNAFSFWPPTIGIGPGSRRGINKDSLRNIKETGEFVLNGVTRRLAELANLCSAELDDEVDEWAITGLERAPSRIVAPPRVAASPTAFECRVRQIVDLGDPEQPTNSLVIASVVDVFVDDDAMDGRTPRPDVIDLVGRMGGDWWCTTRDRFVLPRPGTTDVEELERRAGAARCALDLHPRTPSTEGDPT
jgi:flavin reductase (DIM6/NTAB) family NADH-FMN oxidoreductase RutF